MVSPLATDSSSAVDRSANPTIAIVGGGITGLAAARRLYELDPKLRFTLYESEDRVGGVLETICTGECLVE